MICYVRNKIDQGLDSQEFYNTFIMWQNNFIETKTIYKYVVAPILQDELQKNQTNNEIFSINLQFVNDQEDDQAIQPFQKYLKDLHSSKFQEKMNKKIKFEGNQKPKQVTATHFNVQEIVKLDYKEFLEIFNYQSPQIGTAVEFSVDLFHQPIYIMGNYLKFSRLLSQTKWYLEGKRASESSIQEQIEKVILPLFKSNSNKFHAGGREDLDVRMLGQGRPFVFEVENPKRSLFNEQDLLRMEQEINKSNLMNVNSLKITDRSCFEVLKESEQHKIKQYAAVIYTTGTITEEIIKKLEQYRDLKINQNTPLRVLHRRTLMVREKCIHKMKVQFINQNLFVLHILASAGTYIKEFVHGDLDRTTPNIGQILNIEADILQLDVIKLFTELNQQNIQEFENTEQFQI